MNRPLLIVVGPLPPPVHGVAVSTSLALANSALLERFRVEHLDTSDARSGSNMGRWDSRNVFLGVRAVLALSWKVRRRKGVLYLPLSENRAGFLRDSLFIHVAALRGWKVAVHIRNSIFPTFYDAQGPIFRAWIRLTLRRMTGLAVLGESLRKLFTGLVPEEKVSVVPNGTPDFDADGIGADPKRVLFLSNFRRKKGTDRAVETALLVVERRPDVRFVFAGEWESPEFAQEVRSLAARANGRIEFRPPVTGKDKHALMASSWVLLFPVSWGEGHPRILLEALAAGLPAVTTDRATIAETIIDGESGFVLPDPVPTELADRVLLLLDDHELRERMSCSARTRYEERFTQASTDRVLADWIARVAIA